jgi:hypothetical protein
MIRERDCIYGAVVTRRLRAMGIRDQPIAPASFCSNKPSIADLDLLNTIRSPANQRSAL